MKKIGILTFQKLENYGASLQCHALWQFLKNSGYDVEVIDLLCRHHRGFERTEGLVQYMPQKGFIQKVYYDLRVNLVSYVRGIFFQREKEIRTRNFQKFWDIATYSREYPSTKRIKESPPDYDVYISGSDQVWNPNLKYDWESYFFTFVSSGKKKIAYSSSFGLAELPEYFMTYVKKYLSEFSAISVRERTGQSIIQNALGGRVPRVVDPSFLLCRKEWAEFLVESPESDDYILCVWYLYHWENHLRICADLVKKYHKKVVLIVPSGLHFYSSKLFTVVQTAGPAELIGYISKAKMVLTDSFHVTVFSIIFGIQFYSFVSDTKLSDRLETMLTDLHLEERLLRISNLSNMQKIVEPDRINYDEVQNTLDALCNASKSFLLDAIEK